MELHERLVAARKFAKFDTAADAAAAMGVNYQTYAGHENGNSGFRAQTGRIYARRFKVRFEWLMNGDGQMVDLSSKYAELLDNFDHLPEDLQEKYADILRTLAAPYSKSGPDRERKSEGTEES